MATNRETTWAAYGVTMPTDKRTDRAPARCPPRSAIPDADVLDDYFPRIGAERLLSAGDEVRLWLKLSRQSTRDHC